MKIAIQLFGHLRTYKKCWPALKKHLGEKKLLLDMRRTGKSINEIAIYFNACPTTVRYHLKKLETNHA